MTPERWQEIKRVLNAALELEPAQRPAYLDHACAEDHSLRREVQSLLDSGDYIRSSFLQSPPAVSLLAAEGTADEGLKATVRGWPIPSVSRWWAGRSRTTASWRASAAVGWGWFTRLKIPSSRALWH
jgi:hypothetical protein